MRIAETVLAIIQTYSERKLPLRNVYRLLYNRDLYLRAYARLYSNEGAMTQGSTGETVDGMSLEKIDRIIELVRYERYRWTPVRRTYIPKKNGKMRPLGMPTWSDKLLQEVIRMILETYYNIQFSHHSHGFRPERGCHTALGEIKADWTGTKWFIEGDIKGCFDNIDHTVLTSILRENIHDNRFLRLIEGLLKAGYLEDWKYNNTMSGTPQGGVISPLLSNIYLDRLDKYVEDTLVPAYSRGKDRTENPEYLRRKNRAAYLQRIGRGKEAAQMRHASKQVPSGDPYDPHFRRLKYVRYADDFLLGFIGPKEEAEQIKEELRYFLHEELKLEMSQEKTLITHAQTDAARFLGYEVKAQSENSKQTKDRRSVNGIIGLRVPAKVIQEQRAKYRKNGKAIHKPEHLNESDYAIVQKFQWKYRGLVQYYALATNISWFQLVLQDMGKSLIRTLAAKHKTTRAKIMRQFMKRVLVDGKYRTCLEVKVEREGKEPLIARFGAIPLVRPERAVIHDCNPNLVIATRNDLIKRFLHDTCEICGSRLQVEVHHVRKLKDLNRPGRRQKPNWMRVMSAMRRKTLVVCKHCHWEIHTGRLDAKPAPTEEINWDWDRKNEKPVTIE